MIDVSLSTSSTSPIGLSDLAGISPFAFRALNTATSVALTAGGDPGSSIVTLSEEGQLLSALAVSGLAADASVALAALTQPTVTAAVVQTVDSGTLLTADSANANPALLAPAVAIEALQQLPVDSVLAQIQLTDLDFTAARVAETGNRLPTTAPASGAAPSIDATEEVPGATLASPETPATPLATPVPAPTTTGTLGEANAADSEAFAAALALQDLLADPMRHAANNLFDPAYAALIAASRMKDFVMTEQETNPGAVTADFPTAVSPVSRLRAVASYLEAGNSELRQRDRAIA